MSNKQNLNYNDIKNLNKERFEEEYEEVSDLLWPSDKEDQITRKFYSDLTNLTENENINNKIKRLNFFELILSLIRWQRQLKFIFFCK